jgi:hypothetical protein
MQLLLCVELKSLHEVKVMDLHGRRKGIRGWGVTGSRVLKRLNFWVLRPLPRHQPFRVGLWDKYPQGDFAII